MWTRLRLVDWDRVMGITSAVCAFIIVASWIINPVTMP